MSDRQSIARSRWPAAGAWIASWTTRSWRTSRWPNATQSRAGLSPEAARREARQRFGGVQQVREEHRDQRGAPWVENLTRDVRHGGARLVKDPAFTFVAVAILALGIGANAAMFSLVDGVLLKPMPFPDPERVVRVWEAPNPTSINQTTAFNFTEWRRLGHVVRGDCRRDADEHHHDTRRRADAAARKARLRRLLQCFRHQAASRPNLYS